MYIGIHVYNYTFIEVTAFFRLAAVCNIYTFHKQLSLPVTKAKQ